MRALMGSSDQAMRNIEQQLEKLEESEDILKDILESRADFVPFKHKADVQARLLQFLDEVE